MSLSVAPQTMVKSPMSLSADPQTVVNAERMCPGASAPQALSALQSLRGALSYRRPQTQKR